MVWYLNAIWILTFVMLRGGLVLYPLFWVVWLACIVFMLYYNDTGFIRKEERKEGFAGSFGLECGGEREISGDGMDIVWY